MAFRVACHSGRQISFVDLAHSLCPHAAKEKASSMVAARFQTHSGAARQALQSTGTLVSLLLRSIVGGY